jgi:hypothetical protein
METHQQAARVTQGYTALRNYRYERKFIVDGLLPDQVEALIKLHPCMFYETYPPRYVNNIYFDTPDMENYYDNVNGANRRRKVRLRWYGAAFGEINQPVLEFKIKDGLVGTKHSYPLASFKLDRSLCRGYFEPIARASELPQNVLHDLCNLDVVLFNRYSRRYYASRDGHFRATLDTDMAFYKANGTFGNAFIHHQTSDRELVMELKYEVDQEPRANLIASFFPFRSTRNSKYMQGIERVYF